MYQFSRTAVRSFVDSLPVARAQRFGGGETHARLHF